MKDLQFYIDSETGMPHIYNHQVEEYEVEEVMNNRFEDRADKNNSRSAIGQTEAGRYLRVIYAIKAKFLFIITAYELQGKGLKTFKRRQRKKQ